MGRDKMHKPRKQGKPKPRIVDMPNVPVETKKNVVLSHIMSTGDPMGRAVRELVERRYGEFTVEERDVLDLPEEARKAALNDLAFYASAQLPADAAMGAQEVAVRTAANCQQALARLSPLIQANG
ncbi:MULTISPECIES: hypothetical protein [Streptomyces]|uniref:hypothetical protein n=1 Tax=Streptomyces TaxID=1883 RepID=UPI002108B139|nr:MULTISPECIES: hypothetical protein [Streptomyces]UUA11585.1 hypothetical protein NNW98_38890 [Streptomyces koelreuteriae]UUA19210.1 hypothetical protein NNW99_38925 [Streptomyces sp. CRCS-T-1]